jgi:hypothetical protein
MFGSDEKCIRTMVGKPEGQKPLGTGLDVYVMIILKLTLKKPNGRVSTE